MANIIKLKRGLKTDLDKLVLQPGEIAITTDTNELVAANSNSVIEILTSKADNSTIKYNDNNKIQTVGVIDSNTNLANKFWTGTTEEYNAIETKDENTFYYITDDNENARNFYVWDGLSSTDNPENINLFQQILNTFLNGEEISILILNNSLVAYGATLFCVCNSIGYIPEFFPDGSGYFIINSSDLYANSAIDLDSTYISGKATFSQDHTITEVNAVEITEYNINIPTKTSELTNDSDFATTSYVDNKIQMTLDGTTLNITLGE